MQEEMLEEEEEREREEKKEIHVCMWTKFEGKGKEVGKSKSEKG
jgi:hypothetical protein